MRKASTLKKGNFHFYLRGSERAKSTNRPLPWSNMKQAPAPIRVATETPARTFNSYSEY